MRIGLMKNFCVLQIYGGKTKSFLPSVQSLNIGIPGVENFVFIPLYFQRKPVPLTGIKKSKKAQNFFYLRKIFLKPRV